MTPAADTNAVALLAALLAFVGALLGAALATAATLYTARLRRFASERWWERQASAYIDTVDLLAKTRNRVALIMSDLEHAKALPPAQVLQVASGLAARGKTAGQELTELAGELQDLEPRGRLLLTPAASRAVWNCMTKVVSILRYAEGGTDKDFDEAGHAMVAALDEAIEAVGREVPRGLSLRRELRLRRESPRRS